MNGGGNGRGHRGMPPQTMGRSRLLVDLIACIALGEVGDYLTGGCEAGVDIGLGGLRAHFLGGEEHAVGKLLDVGG